MRSPILAPTVPPVSHRHPRAALASIQLGRSVYDFIAERKAGGQSYRAIAYDLRDATDGETDVTDQTIRAWHLSMQAEDVA